MSKPSIIFLVEDDSTLLDIAKYQLETAGYKVHPFSSGEKALAEYEKHQPDLILSDLILEGEINGDQLLKKIKVWDKNLPIIIMTANGTIDSAVDCVRSGAWNYLTKPFHWDDMLIQIQKALSYSSVFKENIHLKKLVGKYEKFDNIIGESSVMIHVKKQMQRLVESDAPVLILGESGTGKEMVARALHLNGSRKKAPFIAINCGAIVKELAESELFGHVKGAFTGADSKKNGFFMEANEGTIFLDEIAELPLNLQVKLLRVLQESEITPVGQSKTVSINVRVITATNVDLQEAIASGDFREDLFYRISVLPLSLPPLRDRHGDLEKLCDYFLKKLGRENTTLSQALLALFESHEWKGNIRELENVITRLTVLNPSEKVLDSTHLPHGTIRNKPTQAIPFEIPEEGLKLDYHMRRLIESALQKCDGNQTHAAKLLGVTRSALIYRMQKLNITDLVKK